MSGVVIIFKNGQFIHEQATTQEPAEFSRQFLEANGYDLDNLQVTYYPRLKYLEYVQKSKNPNITFNIEPNRIFLTENKETQTPVEIEIDWLNESDLENYYDQATIDLINENRTWSEQQGSLTNINLDDFPNDIPLVTRTGYEKGVINEFLEEYEGEEVSV